MKTVQYVERILPEILGARDVNTLVDKVVSRSVREIDTLLEKHIAELDRRAKVLARDLLGEARKNLAETLHREVGSVVNETRQEGGPCRFGWESSFGWTSGFDPTGEYLANGFAIYSSLLVRTLVGYNHVPGAAGNKVVPDLATTVAKPTNGGKTYTFKLKTGIRFAPPVSREITSKDIKYALERAARPKNGAQYGFYYAVIKGWDAYGAGKAKSIAGIKTPNDKTIVFDLTTPTGDFPFRLAMPAAGPIPQEVAKCFEGQAAK